MAWAKLEVVASLGSDPFLRLSITPPYKSMTYAEVMKKGAGRFWGTMLFKN